MSCLSYNPLVEAKFQLSVMSLRTSLLAFALLLSASTVLCRFKCFIDISFTIQSCTLGLQPPGYYIWHSNSFNHIWVNCHHSSKYLLFRLIVLRHIACCSVSLLIFLLNHIASRRTYFSLIVLQHFIHVMTNCVAYIFCWRLYNIPIIS